MTVMPSPDGQTHEASSVVPIPSAPSPTPDRPKRPRQHERSDVVLTVNTLLEATNAESPEETSGTVRRVLFIDVPEQAVALIDVVATDAWPEWETFGELEEALTKGRLRVRADDPWFADTRPDEELTPASRRIRDARLDVVRPLVSLDVDPDQRILRAEGRGRLVHAAHLATGKAEDKIYGWLRRYWQRGQIDNALLPEYQRCGVRRDGQPTSIGAKKRGRPSKLAIAEGNRTGLNVTEQVRVLLVRGGTRYWRRLVQGKRLTLRQAFERTLQDYFHKRLELRDGHLVAIVSENPEDANRLPTFRQFSYWLAKARETDADLKARWGARRWALTHRPVLGSSQHLSKGPGDLYLIDATVADIYLLSSMDPRWIIGRPVLYLVVDHFSRMIAGLYVGLEGPSWVGAMMALENALTEKVSFCAQYGVEITEEDWPCHQVPRQITGDRGEMIGAPSDGLVPGFRITVSNTPSFRADFKSYVEGQFKISNEKGIARMPGWVDKLRGRGDADYRLDARLDLHHFTRLMIELALHHNKRRRLESQLPTDFPLPRGMDPRPLDLWEWGIANRLGCGREFPRDRVRVNLLPTVRATATRAGFAIHGGLLHYDSATARERGWFTREKGRRAERVMLSVDHRDVSRAYLRLEDGRRIEECPLTEKDAELYAGRSLAEVLDRDDRFELARQAERGARHQEEAEHQARLDQIRASAERQRRTRLELAPDETAPAPRPQNIREKRREERDHVRAHEAFTRRPIASLDDGESPRVRLMTGEGAIADDGSTGGITEVAPPAGLAHESMSGASAAPTTTARFSDNRDAFGEDDYVPFPS